MHGAPGELRLRARHRAPAEHLDDGGPASDRRHRPLVAVGEVLASSSRRSGARSSRRRARRTGAPPSRVEAGSHRSSGRRSRPRRRRRRPQGGRAAGGRRPTAIRLPRASSIGSERASSFPCSPAPQTSVCAFSTVAGLQRHAGRRDGRDRLAGHHLDGAVGERLRRVLAQLRLEHREELGAGLDDDQPRLGVCEAPVVPRELGAVELRERTCGLDSGRAAADDDDVEGAVVDQARVAVGRLPPLEDVVLRAGPRGAACTSGSRGRPRLRCRRS